jgi:SAM-dependent methyltransferase
MPLPLALVQSLVDPLFSEVDAYRLSHQSRNRLALRESSFVYGETLAEPFYDLLQRMKIGPGGCFMDLGSGMGRAVLYASLFLEPTRAVGVELLPELLAAAKATTEVLRAALDKAGHPHTLGAVEWREGSFLELDLGPADFVYIVNAVYEDSLMKAFIPKLSTLKPGCRVVSIGNPIDSERLLTEAKHVRYWTGWGKSFAFLYRVR